MRNAWNQNVIYTIRSAKERSVQSEKREMKQLDKYVQLLLAFVRQQQTIGTHFVEKKNNEIEREKKNVIAVIRSASIDFAQKLTEL